LGVSDQRVTHLGALLNRVLYSTGDAGPLWLRPMLGSHFHQQLFLLVCPRLPPSPYAPPARLGSGAGDSPTGSGSGSRSAVRPSLLRALIARIRSAAAARCSGDQLRFFFGFTGSFEGAGSTSAAGGGAAF